MISLISMFPLFALTAALAGYFFPATFAGFQPIIVPGLAGIMFTMGLTLSKVDLQRVAQRPMPIFIGVGLQFLVMPLLALVLSKLIGLSPQLTAGMVLVGASAGGTASNVMAYISKGDVALSVSMTMTSTLIGVVATPFLTALYLSQTIEVDTLGLLRSILQIVLGPVIMGILVNHFYHSVAQKIEPSLPRIAMLFILFLIAVISALNAENIVDVGLVTLATVILHNLLGLILGYFGALLCGLEEQQCRTLAIEVGMQNSGLATTLSLQFFSATAAIPGILFTVWHNLSGSLLASYWGKNQVKEAKYANKVS